MTDPQDPLDALAAEAGIALSYDDGAGQPRTAPPETAQALLAAMGLQAATASEAAGTLAALRARRDRRSLPDWLIVVAGQAGTLPADPGAPWRIALEDGTEAEGEGLGLPPLPLGRHRLSAAGQDTWLLSAPPRLPPPPRIWGLTLPLYGLRPALAGGLGDFADLARAVAEAARLGAGFVGINPVHAGFLAADPRAYSPYAPSHRRRLNALHLPCPQDRAGKGAPLVDYDASVAERLDRFRQDFTSFEAAGGDPDFAAFLAAEGDDLMRFARYEALAQRHGAFWSDWPEALRDPDGAAVASAAAEAGRDVRFHAWLQWRADAALQDVARTAEDGGMALGLYLDLAVGTHPHGAETWAAPEQFARGVSLGAPPDAFSAEGQVWGLAPFDPRTLVMTGFAPLAETLRSQLRHAKLLRIDHILGFERTFWAPEGGLPGAYVQMPREALMAVARIEAAREGATIVGEDLGNVPKGLRAAMSAAGLLGCRVAQFERDWDGDGRFLSASDWPEDVLAAFGTHDLPTWPGWRRGADIAARAAVAGDPPEAAADDLADRQADVAAFDAVAGTGDASAEALTAFLARTPSRLVALQIEDLLGLADQANLPGTVTEYPNWRRRLPVGADGLGDIPALREAASIMARNGRKE